MNANTPSANTAEAQAFELFKLLIKGDLELVDFTDPNDGNEACERVTGNAQAAAKFAINLQKIFQEEILKANPDTKIKEIEYQRLVITKDWPVFNSRESIMKEMSIFTGANFINEMLSCFDDNSEQVSQWEETNNLKQNICRNLSMLQTTVSFQEKSSDPVRVMRIAFWYR